MKKESIQITDILIKIAGGAMGLFMAYNLLKVFVVASYIFFRFMVKLLF